MLENIKEAFHNIIKDKKWFLKYLVFVPLFFIPLINLVFMNGYWLIYLKNLFSDKNADLPGWKSSFSDIFRAGANYFLVTIVLMPCFFICSIIAHGIPVLFSIIAILVCLFIPALFINFTEHDFKIGEFFNFKKASKYYCSDYWKMTGILAVWFVIIPLSPMFLIASKSKVLGLLGAFIEILILFLWVLSMLIMPLLLANIMAQIYHKVNKNKSIETYCNEIPKL